ncbi:hypothetical protein DE146DRAFT_630880 [Phaeosphaeria sp. MPI-PUGE-AT-0046c]|nr:hypothetical protein DE146DRAFT_630880 [Phaeosphaeria sp. MPI-PUGE-AT-0046c]
MLQQFQTVNQGTPPTLSTHAGTSPRVALPARLGSRDNPIDLDSSSEPELIGEDEVRAQRAVARTCKCAVCGEESHIYVLPSLADCDHDPQTCGSCCARWVAAQLQESGWREAKCPESKCQARLGYHDVQQLASPDIFQQYDNFIARAAVGEGPNSRWWCRACSFRQIHMSGEEGNIFTCAACGHKTCIIHESTWNEGETCEEYEYRASGRQECDQEAQDAASLAAISKLTKKCPGPNCAYNIEENQGCDHMTCNKCEYEFCWICLVDYKEGQDWEQLSTC